MNEDMFDMTNMIIFEKKDCKLFNVNTYDYLYTVQSLYNTLHYNTDLDITWSCGS